MRPRHPRRDEIICRLQQPGSPSVATISEETGVPTATLYAWLSLARRTPAALSPNMTGGLNMAKRTKPRSPSTKLRLLAGSFGLEGDALTAYCDSNGVTVEELLSWRDLALTGIELSERDGLGVTRKEHDKKVAQLERELRRKTDALAEAAALIVLQKKISDHLDGDK